MKLIVMDVRRTKVAEQADIHLQPRGGTDGAVAWGMMRVLIKEGLVNKPFIDKWCVGYDELVAYAEKFTPEYVEKESGVPAELVVKAARMFAEGPSGITISGQSIMHQHNGCNNARACSLLMALTGNVENPGGGMLPNWPEDYLRWDEGYTRSFIDQKWFNEPEQKAKRIDREFVPVWNEMQVLCSPNMLPEMVEQGRIRAIAGFGMNALIWPSPEAYQEAIRKLDFTFAADNFYRDETHHDMDIVLPAALNFERYAPFGVHGRKVSVRRPVKPQGEAWEDWKIACTIGAAVCDPETFFHGDPVKACDSILKGWGVTYEKQQGVLPNLQTVEFFPPQTTAKHEKALLRFDGKPGFRTPSGKIELVASLQAKHGFPGLPVYVEPPKPTAEYPFKLLNGTRRPYITHSKTRGDQPYLLELEPESTINMNPKDAEKLGIKEGDGVWLISPYCKHKVRAKARVTILCQPRPHRRPVRLARRSGNAASHPAQGLGPDLRVPVLQRRLHPRGKGIKEVHHVPLRHHRKRRPLRRVLCLRGRLQGRKPGRARHLLGKDQARRKRPRQRHQLVPHELHALRRCGLHEGLPDEGDPQGPARRSARRPEEVHRLQDVRQRLSVRRAGLQHRRQEQLLRRQAAARPASGQASYGAHAGQGRTLHAVRAPAPSAASSPPASKRAASTP